MYSQEINISGSNLIVPLSVLSRIKTLVESMEIFVALFTFPTSENTEIPSQ